MDPLILVNVSKSLDLGVVFTVFGSVLGVAGAYLLQSPVLELCRYTSHSVPTGLAGIVFLSMLLSYVLGSVVIVMCRKVEPNPPSKLLKGLAYITYMLATAAMVISIVLFFVIFQIKLGKIDYWAVDGRVVMIGGSAFAVASVVLHVYMTFRGIQAQPQQAQAQPQQAQAQPQQLLAQMLAQALAQSQAQAQAQASLLTQALVQAQVQAQTVAQELAQILAQAQSRV